jgi:hypothetical protein
MGDRTGNVALEAATRLFPEVFPGVAPFEVGRHITPEQLDQMRDVVADSGFNLWSESLRRVGNCAHPIRLVGSSMRVDATTGEVLSSYSSATEPDRVTRVRCNNRRASVCPACSRLYQRDMFFLVRSGVTGGKTVPASVGENPLVFATFTAPSFGPVHGRRDSGACRPRRAQERCQHGRPTGCPRWHAADDPEIGQPLCPDCYRDADHVVWQWWAPALWQRFNIDLKRALARTLGVPRDELGTVATVQYAKVAEFQQRGAVHFHALIRLDGPRDDVGFAPAPRSVDSSRLAEIVKEVGLGVRFTVPAVDTGDSDRVICFGRQLDARPVGLRRRTDVPGQPLTADQAAGYLAKYATKAAADTVTRGNAHHERLQTTVRHLAKRARLATPEAGDSPYAGLGRWVDSLGFRGHFGTKSRRYSTTFTALRRARARARIWMASELEAGRTVDLAALEDELLAAEDETTLVIGNWSFAGAGWQSEGQTLLAMAAAARAREYDQATAEERRTQSRSLSGRNES